MAASTFLLFALFASVVLAKFEVVYPGLVTTVLEQCAANASQPFANQITARSNCIAVFECVMSNIDSSRQSIISSGSSILGFIPTVLIILGSMHKDTVRLHTRHPYLAFCLSIMTVSAYSYKINWMRPSSSSDRTSDSLWPSAKANKTHASKLSRLGIVSAHAVATLGAGGVAWQTVDLGRRAVLSWACWTEFYPLIWLGVAILQHLFAVLFLRISFACTVWDVFRNPVKAQDKESPALVRRKFAHWTNVLVGLLGNANYLYGTIVFSSLTLVSGQNAIKVLVLYGFVAAVARVIAAWALQEIDDWDETASDQ